MSIKEGRTEQPELMSALFEKKAPCHRRYIASWVVKLDSARRAGINALSRHVLFHFTLYM